MALAVQQPSEPDYIYYLNQQRYLPGRPEGFNPTAKHPRRPFHWDQTKAYARHGRADPLTAQLRAAVSVPEPRPHHLALYAANVARHRNPQYVDTWWNSFEHHRLQNFARKGRAADTDEGLDIARSSDVQLPNERRRPPSLERQNAFRAAATAKGTGSLKRSFTQHAISADDDELRRLGLLYDNEHERGEAFSLEAIVHEEPLFSVKTRPAKRRGRQSLKRRQMETEGKEMADFALDLALSFAALGDDEALAAFLMSPDESEMEQQHEEEEAAFVRSVCETAPRVTVLYELEEEEELEEERGEREEDNDGWDFLDGSNSTRNDKGGKEEEEDCDSSDTATMANTDADADAWIVLGSDGS